MSAEIPHKENSGVLFPNKAKWIEEKAGRPAHGGEATIVCQCCKKASRYRVAAWNKTGSESGRPLLSLSFTVPQEKRGAK